MAATIYSVPEELGCSPELDIDHVDKYLDARKSWIETVSQWARNNTPNRKSDLVGFVWRYRIADGYAEYVVFTTSPLGLIDVTDDDDGYGISDIVRRGLRVSDIRRQVTFEKRWKEVAGRA